VKQLHQATQATNIFEARSIQNGGSNSVSLTNHQSISERLTGIIKNAFPKHARRRAVSLLRYLINFGQGVFEIDGSGTLILHGRKMDSSITDYINCALLNDQFQHHGPKDFNRFIIALNQINVPAHLLQKSDDKKFVSEKQVTKKSKWLPY
jgi:hypothetical protein